MFRNKEVAFGWVIGYFLLTYPPRMAMPHSMIYSLIHTIIGLAVAVGILLLGRSK